MAVNTYFLAGMYIYWFLYFHWFGINVLGILTLPAFPNMHVCQPPCLAVQIFFFFLVKCKTALLLNLLKDHVPAIFHRTLFFPQKSFLQINGANLQPLATTSCLNALTPVSAANHYSGPLFIVFTTVPCMPMCGSMTNCSFNQWCDRVATQE